MALRIVLADAELELAPAEIAGHPAVRRPAQSAGKRPGQVLLDQNVHGQAMARLADGKRRGRPDIVQYCLLTLLESPLAKGGGLEVLVHTRHGDAVRIRAGTRPPRGEARFQGLLAKVLTEGRSQEGGEPLLWLEPGLAPRQVLDAFAKGPVIRLDEGGPVRPPADVAAKAVAGELTLVVGAFPSGDFSDGWLTAAPETISIWPEPLNAWAVAGELAAAFRARWGPTGEAQPSPASAGPRTS